MSYAGIIELPIRARRKQEARAGRLGPVVIGKHEYHFTGIHIGSNSTYNLGLWQCKCGARRILATSHRENYSWRNPRKAGGKHAI